MKVENPNALKFIIQEDVYLLIKDKEPTLVSTKPSESDTSEPANITNNPSFKYLGENLKNIMVLVNYTTEEVINDSHLAALTSTLSRKDITINDVAIVNTANYSNHTWQQLTAFFSPLKVLIMGKPSLPPNIPQVGFNKPQNINNTLILYTYSFDEMMNNIDNKKAFWEQVKNF